MFYIKGMRARTIASALASDLKPTPRPKHVFICVADHFEPDWMGAKHSICQSRVARWVSEYPMSVKTLSDSRGRPPQHTFFFPIETYREDLVESLAALAREGFGDIEVHLHHDNDNAERLAIFLNQSIERLHSRHGLLSKDRHGRIRYGFIHGNWALDNSHPEGRWCGVNNELTVLRQTGCYADFTMPAAPHRAQTQTINSVYYAADDPRLPKSHDTGIAASVGQAPPTETLLMIQGPLTVRFLRNRLRPRVENGNLACGQPPSGERLMAWLRACVCVRGHDHWQFIKLHTHGAQENNAAVLLGEAMLRFHLDLRSIAQQRNFQYYYVTAREMAQLVGQAEQGFELPDFSRLGWE